MRLNRKNIVEWSGKTTVENLVRKCGYDLDQSDEKRKGEFW